MTESEFLAEVQSLRQLVVEKSSYDPWLAMPTWADDEPTIKLFHALMSQVFGSAGPQRDARLQSIGLLIGKEVETTVGKNGLTLAEMRALIDWMKVPGSTSMRIGAYRVLGRLRDNPALWGQIIINSLGAVLGKPFVVEPIEDLPLFAGGSVT